MNIFRIDVKMTKEIPNTNGGLHKTIRKVVSELESCKANNIHVNGNVVTFKNNAWEWRLDWDLMGVLKEGKFELSETENGIIINVETYYSILNDFLLFPPMTIFFALYFNDLRALFFLLGTVFGIIIKKVIVSTKLEDIFEVLKRNINDNKIG
jgi:hypothetical protein